MINEIILFRNYPRKILGMALNFFHYYTYFKSFKKIDRIELALTCVYLAYKIKVGWLKPDNIIELYPIILSNFIDKENISLSNRNKNPDIVEIEMEFFEFLGYDYDMENPYNYIIEYKDKFKLDETVEFFAQNIITDSFRRPFCIYYHPRTIAVVSIFLAIMISKGKDFDFELRKFLEKENRIVKSEFDNCFENLYDLMLDKLEDGVSKFVNFGNN